MLYVSSGDTTPIPTSLYMLTRQKVLTSYAATKAIPWVLLRLSLLENLKLSPLIGFMEKSNISREATLYSFTKLSLGATHNSD